MKTLYTTFIGYKSSSTKVKFYTELPQSTISLIESRVNKLLLNSTASEKETAYILQTMGIDYEEQIMFMIDGHMYFCDFYLCDMGLVIEVDGGVHKKQLDYDSLRDKRFKSVGLKVLRIKNELVNKENIELMLSKNISMGYKNKQKRKVKKGKKTLSEAQKIRRYQNSRKGSEKIPKHWLNQGI